LRLALGSQEKCWASNSLILEKFLMQFDRGRTRFVWDEAKAQSNLRKHGISFEEAALVFDDPLATSVHDRIMDGEVRWHIIGMGKGCLLLLVVHTFREIADTEVVRIISARRAEPYERRLYGNG
jgi:uncharacterized protein